MLIDGFSPARTVLVQMVSAAGTGYFFNTKRNRLRDKLVLRKHDPFGNSLLTSCALHMKALLCCTLLICPILQKDF